MWNSGRSRSEIFMDLPSKQDYPDYYLVIKHPISFNTIRERVESEYNSIEDFISDCDQMFENAMLYNLEDSLVYQDALELQRLLNELKDDMYARVGESELIDVEAADINKEMGKGTIGGRSLERMVLVDQVEHDGRTYCTGDFAYAREGDQRYVTVIKKIFVPETDHVASPFVACTVFLKHNQLAPDVQRRMLEQEVYRKPGTQVFNVDALGGKCYVMYYKDYRKYKPINFEEKDVFVCSCRYAESAKRQFPYISDWQKAIGVHPKVQVELEERPNLLSLTRQPLHTPEVDRRRKEMDSAVKQPPFYARPIDNFAATPIKADLALYEPHLVTVVQTKPIVPTEPPSLLSPSLPQGVKLIKDIQIKDAVGNVDLVLHPEPSSHSINVGNETSTLRVHLTSADLSPYGDAHKTAVNRFTIYQNSQRVQEDASNSFNVPLEFGLNILEIWAIYHPQSVFVPAHYSTLQIQNVVQEIGIQEQQYCLFVLRT
jgi:hypothetical protein